MTAVLIVLMSLLLSRPAPFGFVYRVRDGRWHIVDHHSSVVPAPSP